MSFYQIITITKFFNIYRKTTELDIIGTFNFASNLDTALKFNKTTMG